MELLLFPIAALVLLIPVLPPGGGWNNPPAAPVPGVRHKTFRSDAMGVDVGYNVYLPPDYDKNPERRYPVVYWLHGLGGNETNGMFPADVIGRGVRDGAAPPLILVSATGGQRTRYHDSADGKIMADTLISRELVAHVDKTYRTIATRSGRSIQGMSMGGNGALKFAFKYPELFGSVVAYAPALVDGDWMEANDPEFLRTMFAGDKNRYQREIAAEVLKRNVDAVRRHDVKIFITVGTADALLDRVRAMHRLLEELKVPHRYEELEGVPHDMSELLRKDPARGLAFATAHLKPSEKGPEK
jgi:endo-1,4-beta-xylanase